MCAVYHSCRCYSLLLVVTLQSSSQSKAGDRQRSIKCYWYLLTNTFSEYVGSTLHQNTVCTRTYIDSHNDLIVCIIAMVATLLLKILCIVFLCTNVSVPITGQTGVLGYDSQP